MCCAMGQDSHRFEEANEKPLILGGLVIEGEKGLAANSDGDVLLHALTNAISGVTGRNILGPVADALCRAGFTDSWGYLNEALRDLKRAGGRIRHVSFSVEAARPKLLPHIPAIRQSVADMLQIPPAHVGLTATSGEGLTAFGRGEGIQVLCLLTAELPEESGEML
ncbi:MAG: 2-C-methyl-D-erythritol 2,4-cyclodiphosphate synthase [Lachnospiraceae bacterium]|nr:2-C-methyl-D-erythritol 2,4-cyclodiphosphate synthase [Lachnospiraceae bacterium]